jgi:hypothetical protein
MNNIVIQIKEEQLFKDKGYRREVERIFRDHTSIRGEFRKFTFEDSTEAILLIKDYYLDAVDQNPLDFMKIFKDLDHNGIDIGNYIYPNFSSYKKSDFSYMKFDTVNIKNNISSKIKFATKKDFDGIKEDALNKIQIMEK